MWIVVPAEIVPDRSRLVACCLQQPAHAHAEIRVIALSVDVDGHSSDARAHIARACMCETYARREGVSGRQEQARSKCRWHDAGGIWLGSARLSSAQLSSVKPTCSWLSIEWQCVSSWLHLRVRNSGALWLAWWLAESRGVGEDVAGGAMLCECVGGV